MMYQNQKAYYSSRSNVPIDDSKQIQLLQYNNFTKILTDQSHQIQQSTYIYPKFLNCIGNLCIPFCLCCQCFGFSYPLHSQKTSQIGLLQRFGKFIGQIKPGLNIINPLTQKVYSVDLKTQIVSIQQQCITKDNINILVDSVIFMRVVNPQSFTFRLGDNSQQMKTCVAEVAKAALRFLIGKHEFQNLVEIKKEFTTEFGQEIQRQVETWGIQIENSSIKQLILPPQLSQSLSSIPKTKRKIQANVINCKADVQSAKLLAEISQVLDTKASMQIRYLEAVQQIIENNLGQENVIYMTISKGYAGDSQITPIQQTGPEKGARRNYF